MRIRLDGDYSARVDWAVSTLEKALSNSGLDVERVEGADNFDGCDLYAGTAERSSLIRNLQNSGELALSADAESLAIRQINGALVVAGSGEQGLMYGLLEVADHVPSL